MKNVRKGRKGRIGKGLTWYRAALTAMFVGAAAGCDSLLEVELPTRVPAATLDDPKLAPVLVQGAIADFECALTNYIAATGLLTDELLDSTGWIAVTMWDQRRIFSDNDNLGTSGCTALGYGIFTPLQTARFQASDAYDRISGFSDTDVPNRNSLLAQAAVYAGYSLTILGEGFCEATVDQGPVLQPTAVLQLAEERFTQAIDHATGAGDDQVLNMARVGRARVRLNQGQLQEAAADAELVPEGFVANATYSSATTRRWNRVYADNYRNLYITVHPSFRGLEVDGVPDPRVEAADAGRRGHDGVTELWLQTKYVSDNSPISIASWEEAQLIIAEARGGQEAVDAINRLRAASSLPSFNSADPAEIETQVREERRRELFLQGHRLNDMLRMNLPFPSGATHKGVPYGETKCLPLPDAERQNNPNVSG